MFEDIFTRKKRIDAYRSAPLSGERLKYLHHLCSLGASKKTLRNVAANQLNLVNLLDLSQEKRVDLAQLETAVQRWSEPGPHRQWRTATSQAKQIFIGHAAAWLRFIGRLEEAQVFPPHNYHDELIQYELWLRTERGLAEQTIQANCRIANWFLEWLCTHELLLGCIGVKDVEAALLEAGAQRQWSRVTRRTYVDRLRIFFNFAQSRKWCIQHISESLSAPRYYPDQSIPKGLSRVETANLLKATKGDHPAAIRDHAIVRILSTYGIRSGELCALRLDDIEWHQERIQVRCPKVGRTSYFPLSAAVGDSILRYLQKVRYTESAERCVFLTLRMPYAALNCYSVYGLIKRRMNQAGIRGKRRGPHSLRHTAAQHLIDQGMTMKTVGDYLGHRSIDATSVYAKVDLDTLREVADFNLEDLL